MTSSRFSCFGFAAFKSKMAFLSSQSILKSPVFRHVGSSTNSRIRNAAVGQSKNPDFNEMMDAFCGQGGLRAAGKMFDEKLGFNHVDESQNKKN